MVKNQIIRNGDKLEMHSKINTYLNCDNQKLNHESLTCNPIAPSRYE